MKADALYSAIACMRLHQPPAIRGTDTVSRVILSDRPRQQSYSVGWSVGPSWPWRQHNHFSVKLHRCCCLTTQPQRSKLFQCKDTFCSFKHRPAYCWTACVSESAEILCWIWNCLERLCSIHFSSSQCQGLYNKRVFCVRTCLLLYICYTFSSVVWCIVLWTHWLGFHFSGWGTQPKAVDTEMTGRNRRCSSR